VCPTANYTANATDGSIVASNSAAKYSPTGPREVIVGQVKQVSGGALEITYAPPSWNMYVPYDIVLLTGDASSGYSVAIIYSCSIDSQSQPTFWVMSRTPQLPAAVPYDTLVSKIQSWGFDPTAMGLMQTQQPTTCVY
jgi:lipocalin